MTRRVSMHTRPLVVATAVLMPILVAGPASAQSAYISGAPFPSQSDFRSVAEAKIKERLKDPSSAEFKWGEPFKVSCNKGLFRTPQRWLGWSLMVEVNAKNSFGGFTGFQPMTVLIANDGTDDIVHVPYANNVWKFGLCKREDWQ